MLTTEGERDCFARHLREVREMRGAGFAETPRSLTGIVHLKFGNLYGLFDDRRPGTGMLGGFAMHHLAMFGQSFPRPDLSHLPPDKVFECGELWAAAAGAAPILRQAGLILAGRFNAVALLLYPIFRPWNLSSFYNKGFERTGDPIEWPYVRTLAGGKILVQPMVSQSGALQNLVDEAEAYGFQALQEGKELRFNTPHSVCMRSFSERVCRTDWSVARIKVPSRARRIIPGEPPRRASSALDAPAPAGRYRKADQAS
jgi:hypothetical protein